LNVTTEDAFLAGGHVTATTTAGTGATSLLTQIFADHVTKAIFNAVVQEDAFQTPGYVTVGSTVQTEATSHLILLFALLVMDLNAQVGSAFLVLGHATATTIVEIGVMKMRMLAHVLMTKSAAHNLLDLYHQELAFPRNISVILKEFGIVLMVGMRQTVPKLLTQNVLVLNSVIH